MDEELEKPTTSAGIPVSTFNCTPEQLTPVLVSVRKNLGEGMAASQILQEAKPPPEDEANLLSVVESALEKDQPKRAFDKLLPDEYVTAVFAAPDVAALLGDIRKITTRFMHMEEHYYDVIALWTLHTYIFKEDRHTPYLLITSAEGSSGKSLLLEILELLVHEPYLAVGSSNAALARIIDHLEPTLMIDEFDNQLNFGKETTAQLTSLINSGNKRGGGKSMVTGKDHEVKKFKDYCPKIFAGIEVPIAPTTLQRSIPLKLHVKPQKIKLESFRMDLKPNGITIEEEFKNIKKRIEEWAGQTTCYEKDVEELNPEELPDRARDAWNILFKVANEAGADWIQRAQEAAIQTMTGREDSKTVGVQLLEAIHRIFEKQKKDNFNNWDKIFTSVLVMDLRSEEESIWGAEGYNLNDNQLTRTLKKYGVDRGDKRDIRIGSDNKKGWQRYQFIKAWERYTPWLLEPPPEDGDKGDTGDSVTLVTHVTPPEGHEQSQLDLSNEVSERYHHED